MEGNTHHDVVDELRGSRNQRDLRRVPIIISSEFQTRQQCKTMCDLWMQCSPTVWKIVHNKIYQSQLCAFQFIWIYGGPPRHMLASMPDTAVFPKEEILIRPSKFGDKTADCSRDAIIDCSPPTATWLGDCLSPSPMPWNKRP